MCRPKGYGFWAALVWKRVYILNILVWNWVWLSGECSRKLLNLFFFPATRATNWWERNGNTYNISFQLYLPIMLNHVQGQVWKQVWIFEARSENGCGKWHFWSEIGSRFGDAGGTPPPKIPRSSPPPRDTDLLQVFSKELKHCAVETLIVAALYALLMCWHYKYGWMSCFGN